MADLVPVVDLATPGAAAAVDDACRRFGFFQVAGHGVADEIVEAMLDAAERFFHAPTAIKEACRPPSPDVNRGWSPVGVESLAYSLGIAAPPDLFEAFNIGHEVQEPDGGFFAANPWPAIPGFKEAFVAYFDALAGLARRLTGVAAQALCLPEGFFDAMTDRSPDVLRVNWYATTKPPLPDQQRMGAHTDYGVLTVLWADRVPGLEIVAPDGKWVGVQPEPGCFLVNLGDLLAQWTNDRWRSTLHRVVPGGHLRRSAAFFHEANADALVEVLPTCVDADRPARYAPVVAGDHLRAKLRGSRELQPSTAVSTVLDRPIR